MKSNLKFDIPFDELPDVTLIYEKGHEVNGYTDDEIEFDNKQLRREKRKQDIKNFWIKVQNFFIFLYNYFFRYILMFIGLVLDILFLFFFFNPVQPYEHDKYDRRY